MANNAFRLASQAQPTLGGHTVKLDTLRDKVSRISYDIDDIRTTIQSPPDPHPQVVLLEGTVSRIDAEVVELHTMLTSKPPADILTEPSSELVGADATVSAQRKAPPVINTSWNEESGTERPSTGRHPLFQMRIRCMRDLVRTAHHDGNALRPLLAWMPTSLSLVTVIEPLLIALLSMMFPLNISPVTMTRCTTTTMFPWEG